MSRLVIFIGVALLCLLLGVKQATAQASEQLKQKAKGIESTQSKGWQQIDEINKESDKTRARLQQARESGDQPELRSASTVKKSRVGTGGAYRKLKPPMRSAKRK